jgi:hypothetical protein
MRRKIVWVLIAALMADAVYVAANFPALYARVRMDRSFPALSRYVFESTPGLVLVGSSMTYRLYEGYFQTPVRNLALSGGSPLTGLAIIASYEKLPRTVLVETNIIARPLDGALVSAFGRNDGEPYIWFRPTRAVISKLFYWFKYRPEAVDAGTLLQGPAEDHDIAASVSEVEQEYAGDLHDAEMVGNIETMKDLVRRLERRGCRVMFFEMPFPPPLNESHYAVLARTLARAAFPNGGWINTGATEQELRWVDASHLDERSAAIVARELDRAIKAP